MAEGFVLSELDTNAGYDLSDNGRYLIFAAAQSDGRKGAYLLPVEAGSLHFACIPNAAHLSASGEAEPGGKVTFLLENP